MPGNLRNSGHTPPERTPVDPTPVRGAPGRRDEIASDARITSRIDRREPTPPPLPPSPADAKQWLARARAASDAPAAAAPSVDLTAPMPQPGAPAWVFPLLLAVTALVVGMVLGALLFGHRAARCPPAATPQGVQGSISPTSSSRADEVTALYTAIDRRSV